VNLVGQLCRCVVLVDNRIDAVPDVASTCDRDPPTAIGHHNMTSVQQTPHCPDLHEPAGPGGGHDATVSAAAVLDDVPSASLGQPGGLALGEERSDRLGRVGELRVLQIDDDVTKDAHDVMTPT